MGKPTKYQPTEAQWNGIVCPKCHMNGEFFYNYNDPDDPKADGAILWSDCGLTCDCCGYCVTGEKFAEMCKKQYGHKECPMCHGRGFIRKDKTDG